MHGSRGFDRSSGLGGAARASIDRGILGWLAFCALFLSLAGPVQADTTYRFDDGLIPSGWSTSGAANWYATNSGTYGGTGYSLRAGVIGHSQSSSLLLTATVPAGQYSFAYSVSSEQGFDYLRFYVDDVNVASWSGSVSWATYNYSLTVGTHTLKWTYSKDGSVVAGSDTAWIDEVVLASGVTPPGGGVDSDGDGVADSIDSAPLDPLIPGSGFSMPSVYITTADNENNTHTGVADGDLGSYVCRANAIHPIEANVAVAKVVPRSNAYLSVWINDVDLPSEVDDVYLNGHRLGSAVGEDSLNYSTLFVIPDLSWVKLGNNLVEVLVDRNSSGWCATTRNAQIMVDEGTGTTGTATIRSTTVPNQAYAFGASVTVTVEADTTLASQGVRFESILRDPNGNIINFDRSTAARDGKTINGSATDPNTWTFTLPASGTQGLWAVTAVLYDTGTQRFQALRTVTFGVPSIQAPTITGVTPVAAAWGVAQGISVTGTNFVQGATQCTLGGVSLTNLIVQNNNSLTANVPTTLGVGTQDLVCQTAWGQGGRTAAFTVLGADLRLSAATVDFGRVNVGDTGTRTVIVSNLGNQNLTVPAIQRLSGDAISLAADSCRAQALAPGANCSVELQCAPSVQGTQTAAFGIDSNDPDQPSVQIAATCEGVQADLSVTLDDLYDPLKLNHRQTYRARVLNLGPSDATGATLVHTLPPGVAYQAQRSSAGNCSVSGQEIRCAIGSLAVGAQFTLEVDALTQSLGQVQASAQAAAVEADPNAANNGATSATLVIANLPPVATAGSLSTLEQEPYSGTLPATDGNGDPLTFAIVADGSLGHATITNTATGAFTYTPTAGGFGTDGFTFKATDDDGAASNVAAVMVAILPAVTVNQPAAAVAAATLTLTGTKEAGAGVLVNGAQVAGIDGLTTWSTVLNLAQGQNSFTIRAFSASGTHTRTTTVTVNRDDQPPVVTATAPADGALTNAVVTQVRVTLSDANTGIDYLSTLTSAQVTDGGGQPVAGLWSRDGESALFTASAELPSGVFNVALTAFDQVGNTLPVGFAFRIDRIPPSPVTAAVDAAGDGHTAIMDWSGYDEAGQGDVAGYAVYVNNVPYTEVAALTPVASLPAGSTGYQATGLFKGQTFYFAVVARDALGNALTAVTPTSAVARDTLPPADATGLGARPLADGLALTWTHSVNGAGDLAGYRVYLDGAGQPTAVPATQNSLDLTGIAAAPSHLVRLTSVDGDGNESAGIEVTAQTLKVTLTAPAATATYKPGDQVTLTWTGNGDPTATMVLAMKRGSVPAAETDPDTADPDWYRFTLATANDGTEQVQIPAGLTPAADWRFYVRYAGTRVYGPQAVTFTYRSIPAPTAEILEPSPADPIQGDLVTVTGQAGPADQTIDRWSWSLVRLQDGAEIGDPISVGEAPTLRTDEMTAGDWRLKLQVRNDKEQWSPPATRDIRVSPVEGLADLHIAWSDVDVLDMDGQPARNFAPGETVQLRVTLHNDGTVALPAGAVLRLLDGMTPTPTEQTRVEWSALEPGAQITLFMFWTAPQTTGYQSLILSADFLANVEAGHPVIPEANRFNNEVSLFVIVGDPGPSSFGMGLDLPEILTVHPGQGLQAFGSAQYAWGSHLPVMGALVRVDLEGRTESGRTTSPAGAFAVGIRAPDELGDYPMSLTVFDQALYGRGTIIVRVVPWPTAEYWFGGGGGTSVHPAPPLPLPSRDLVVHPILSGDGFYATDNGVDAVVLGTNSIVSAVVSNVGNLSVAGGFVVEIWDGDPRTDADAQRIGESITVDEDLAPGASLPVQATAQTEFAPLGRRRFYAEVSGVADETQPFNNTGSARVEVRPARPDLRPTYTPYWVPPGRLRLASTPVPGERTRILVDLVNRGPADLTGGFAVNFYEGDPDAGGDWLGTGRYDGDLGAWKAATVSVEWTAGAVGGHRIYAVIDESDAIDEDAEDNNRASTTVQVVPDAPKLTVNLAPSQYSVKPGRFVSLTATVANGGRQPSATTTVTFYQGHPASGGSVIRTVQIPGIAVASSTQAQVDWAALATPGTVTLCAVVGDLDAHQDCEQVQVTDAPVPDLRIYSEDIAFSPGPRPALGAAVTVTAQVRNVSLERTAHNVTVNFFADSPWAFAQIGGPVVIDTIPIGGSVSVSADATLTVDQPYYALMVDVAPDAQEGDANLGDNRATTSFAAANYQSPQVTFLGPIGGTYHPGDSIALEWTTLGADPADEMALSMKRDMAASLPEPDGVNWYRFTENTDNDGRETVTIPTGLAEAADWRFVVHHLASDVDDGSDQTLTYEIAEPPSGYTLTITASPEESGWVSVEWVNGDAESGVIDCRADNCTIRVPEGSDVTLGGWEGDGYRFSLWKGCKPDPVSPRICTLTMDRSKTVAARFLMDPTYAGEAVVYLDDASKAAGAPITIKARGDIVDLIGRIEATATNGGGYLAELTFALPRELEVVGVFSRTDALHYDERTWRTLTDYQTDGAALTISNVPVHVSGRSDEFVVRARVRADAQFTRAEHAYEVAGAVSRDGIFRHRSEVQRFVVHATAHIIVTNRYLLFKAYPNEPEKVLDLLQLLYDEAFHENAIIYFVDKYDKSDDWTTLNPELSPFFTWGDDRSPQSYSDGTSHKPAEEARLNQTTTEVDNYVNYWINNLGGADSEQEGKFLLIVGGDEVIPHYRVWDPWEDIHKWTSRIHLSDVQQAAAEHNYIFSDIIYYDTDGIGWGDGSDLEHVYVGRLTGVSATDIAALFQHGLDKDRRLEVTRTLAIVTREQGAPGTDAWGTPPQTHNHSWSIVSEDGGTNLFDTDNGNKAHLFNVLKDNTIDLLWTYHHGDELGLYGRRRPPLILGTDWLGGGDITAALNGSHPVWIASACYSGITADAFGKGYFAAQTLRQPFAGLLGATSTTSSEQKFFQGSLAKKIIDNEQSVGQAVNETKADFGPRKDLASARFSYVYYGVPWLRLGISHIAGGSGLSNIALASDSAIPQHAGQQTVAFDASGMTVSLTEDIASYRRSAVDAFEVIRIDGFYQSGEYEQPVLPMRRLTIDLPLGAALESLTLDFADPVVETALQLPLLEHVPDAEFADVTGFRAIPDSYGSVPAERYHYYVVQAEGRQVLNIVYTPVTYDPATDEATIYRTTSIDYTIAVPHRGFLRSVSTDADSFTVGDEIVADCAIESLTGEIASFDVTAKLVSPDGSEIAEGTNAISVDSGAVAHSQVAVRMPSSIPDGPYRLEVSAFDGIEKIGTRTLFLQILSGRINQFSATQEVNRGESAQLDIDVANTLAEPVTAWLDIRIYDQYGAKVDQLPQKLIELPATGHSQTTVQWYPAEDLPLGQYVATLVIDTSSAVFGPISRTITLSEPVAPGDLDGDGDVDNNDLTALRARFGQPATGPDDPGDLVRDGQINVLDFRKISTLCTRPKCAVQ